MDSKAYFERLNEIPDQEINLAEAALYIAADEYPNIDIPSYLEQLKMWSSMLRRESARKRAESRFDLLNRMLFEKMHFTGNLDNYYDPRNSFLNDVIDSRKGIPISLCVLYLDLAWSLGLRATGIGFPGRFLVRVEEQDKILYVDCFYQGRILSVEDCVEFWNDLSDGEMEFQHSFLSSLGKRQILVRMLHNLKGIYLEKKSFKKLIHVMDKLVILAPDLYEEIRDRGIIHYQMQAFRPALQDFETYLSTNSEGEDADMIRQYVEVLREYSSHLN